MKLYRVDISLYHKDISSFYVEANDLEGAEYRAELLGFPSSTITPAVTDNTAWLHYKVVDTPL